jgi:hypothetical protein
MLPARPDSNGALLRYCIVLYGFGTRSPLTDLIIRLARRPRHPQNMVISVWNSHPTMAKPMNGFTYS